MEQKRIRVWAQARQGIERCEERERELNTKKKKINKNENKNRKREREREETIAVRAFER